MSTTKKILLILILAILASSCKPKGNFAVIETDYGKIRIKFDRNVAPNHVAHFIELTRAGFYDGLAFHRAEPGLLIQGGDPQSRNNDPSMWGKGDPKQETVDAEFSAKPFVRGTVGMARTFDINSATSQFFICLRDFPSLNGKYTVFGEVVEGIEVVDRISRMPVADPQLGTLREKVVMQRVSIEN